MTNTSNPNYKYILLAEKLEEEGDFLTAERNFLLSVIKNSELSRLGLRRQRMGVIEPYGKVKRDNDYPC